MEQDLRAVANGNMSQCNACKVFNLPRATLQTMISRKSHLDAKPGKEPHLGAELEQKLVDLAGNQAQIGVRFAFLIMLGNWPKNTTFISGKANQVRNGRA
jgi:hypothetical protein